MGWRHGSADSATRAVSLIVFKYRPELSVKGLDSSERDTDPVGRIWSPDQPGSQWRNRRT